MPLLEISDLVKSYKTENEVLYASNIHSLITFPPYGLIGLIGPSGSGKSTILNMIGLIDKPTEGHIYYNDKDIFCFNQKQIDKYHCTDVGFIFQSPQLIENMTVYENLELPILIAGKTKKYAEKRILSLIKDTYIDESLLDTDVCVLSGGERQRVSVAKALANNPQIILADEPTGALDSINAENIFQLLKSLSKNKLIIIVSHDDDLVKKYCLDTLIIKDGKLIKNLEKNEKNSTKPKQNRNILKFNKWNNKIINLNIKERFKKNLLPILGLTVSFMFSFLSIGFINNASKVMLDKTLRQPSYGNATIAEEITIKKSETGISLVQTIKPDFNEIKNEKSLQNFTILPNFDAFIMQGGNIKSDQDINIDYQFEPIYSFSKPYFDESLFIKKMPFNEYDLNCVCMNNAAYQYFEKIADKHLQISYTYHYFDEKTQGVKDDHFYYKQPLKIVGLLEDLKFLNSPKIYYSYVALMNILESTIANSYSMSLEKETSWFSVVENSNNDEDIGSYSYRLFLKDYQSKNLVKQSLDNVMNKYVVTSHPLLLQESLLDTLIIIEKCLRFLIGMLIIFSILILGIICFSNYQSDRKKCAVLSSCGASKSSILDLFITENCLVGLCSLILAVLLSLISTPIINKIIFSIFGVENLVSVPFSEFLNIKYFLLYISIGITILIGVIAACIPIAFSKKISIKDELQTI